MEYRYLVTTRLEDLPHGPVVMVDGTVPGWMPTADDFHFDHHRSGGADVQIEEIPESVRLPAAATFVTTMLDADASAAAAWLQLLQLDLPASAMAEARTRLVAIAYDCDHLGLPEGTDFDPWRQFAANAVAAMKEAGRSTHKRLGLPSRSLCTETQRTQVLSHGFLENVEWLMHAAQGRRHWPGERGEATAYFDRQDALRTAVASRCRVYRGCALFDQRGINEYIDARLPVEWARAKRVPRTFTLTVRDGKSLPQASGVDWPDELPCYSYTLGRIPLHAEGSPRYSDRGVWESLSAAEAAARAKFGLGGQAVFWGGRNDVGGSSFRCPVVMTPEQVLDHVLACGDAT